VAKGSATYVTTPTPGANGVSIGRSGSAGGMQFVNGRLDEVALYPRPLCAARVAAHYALQTATGDGIRIALQLAGTDADDEPLTYGASGLPPPLSIDPAT